MTGHTSRSWSDKGGRFEVADGPGSRGATADPRDGVAYMWCNGHEYDQARVETDYFDSAVYAEPSWDDPFSWWGALLDAIFGPDNPHAEYAASHPGPPAVIGPCCGDSDGRPFWDDEAVDDEAAGAER